MNFRKGPVRLKKNREKGMYEANWMEFIRFSLRHIDWLA